MCRQSCFDWALCVVSTLSGLVCCSRVFWLVAWSHCLSRSTRFGPCLVCIRRFLGPHLGLQDGIQSCAVAFYLVLWQAVLCLFTYLDLVCLHLHLRLWLSSSRGSAFGALSLCSRLCARVRPHLFVCSPIGFSGVPLGVAESEQLLGNTWSPLFQAFVRRLYSLSLYRSDVCAWLALFC